MLVSSKMSGGPRDDLTAAHLDRAQAASLDRVAAQTLLDQ
jgi:hypothetical protein